MWILFRVDSMGGLVTVGAVTAVTGSPQDIGEGADGAGGSGERGGAEPVTGQGRQGARKRGPREAKVIALDTENSSTYYHL